MLRRNIYCTLILISPRYSLATYFDSGSLTKKKDYSRIKSVLDDALEGYASKGCSFANKGAECIRNGKHVFKHVTQFPCVKQSAHSVKEAFYVLHHLRGFVHDCQMLTCHLVSEDGPRGWRKSTMIISEKTSSASRLKYRKSSSTMSCEAGGPYTTPEGCLRERSKNVSKCRLTSGRGRRKRALNRSRRQVRETLDHDVCLE